MTDLKIKTVFFDVGNTLFYASPSRDEIWFEFLTNNGRPVELSALERALTAADSFYETRLFEYNGRMEKFWTIYDNIVLNNLDIPDRDGSLAREVDKWFYQPRWYQLYPETIETLEALNEEGYKLGIVSNNNDDLLKQLEWLNLGKYFESITYSQEARSNKPDPAIFHLALRRTGSSSNETVHVGDKYGSDVVGARETGITPILVDRDNHHPDADCLRITDLQQLPNCIVKL